MDKVLHTSWKNSKKPFNGTMIVCNDFLEISQLYSSIRIIVNILHKQGNESRMLVLHDWHEHDGYITQAKPIDWDEINEMFSSESSLYKSRTGDDFVRNCFYPENLNFLFRYYLPDENDDIEQYPGKWGDFDLCGHNELIDYVTIELDKVMMGKFRKVNAKKYYDDCYAG